MSLKPMYNGKAFSPMAALVNNISAAETVIEVTDITVFPPAPNFATIGIDENAETIEYSQIAGNTLSGCIRGIEGVAKGWGADTLIARNWTNEDYLRLIENIEGKVEKDQNGNADFIVFNDGDTFQEKFDSGQLKGQTGSQGIQGIDGKSVEIRNDNTYIQWRNIGDIAWNNIVALTDLKGADGKSVEIQVANNYIQWRQTGGSWNNLISLDALKGEKGDKGDFADINVDGILKGVSGALVKAVAGTDYTTPTNVDDKINTHNNIGNAHNNLFSNKLDKSGGTLTGGLILNANPIVPLGAVPKQYADAIKTTADNANTLATAALPKSGGTMAGTLIADATALETIAVHNMYAGTTDLEAGISPLPSGTFYFVYE